MKFLNLFFRKVIWPAVLAIILFNLSKQQCTVFLIQIYRCIKQTHRIWLEEKGCEWQILNSSESFLTPKVMLFPCLYKVLFNVNVKYIALDFREKIFSRQTNERCSNYVGFVGIRGAGPLSESVHRQSLEGKRIPWERVENERKLLLSTLFSMPEILTDGNI